MNNIRDAIDILTAQREKIDSAIEILQGFDTGKEGHRSADQLTQAVKLKKTEAAIRKYTKSPKKSSVKKNNQGRIEREDIVECVEVKERDAGVEEDLIPVVGREYRVIEMFARAGKVVGYEVLDDESDNKIRMLIFKDEVKLKRKRRRQPARVVLPSKTVICPECGEETALCKKRDEKLFTGECINCGQTMIEDEKGGIECG